MKNRLLLSVTLLSLMALTFACGGGAANTNTTNVARNTATNLTNTSNTTTNATTNTPSNSASNSTTNSTANKPATTNTASNKPAAANTTSSTANTAGNKIATTQKPPKGATAVCKDGTYSFSKTDSGQCSGHGGVDKKL